MARRFKHPGIKGPKEMSPEQKAAAAEYLAKVHGDLKGMVAGMSIAGSDFYAFDRIKTEINEAFTQLTGRHPPWTNPGYTNTHFARKPQGSDEGKP